MKKLLLVFILISTTFILWGQEKNKPYSRWYLKPAGGINIPLTGMFSDETTDNLIEYDDLTYYWQLISGNFFFHKSWGVDATLQWSTSGNIPGRFDSFKDEMYNKYSDRFYVNIEGQNTNNAVIFGGDITRAYLGLVYRVEKHKFIILPKLSIGFVSYRTNEVTITLKEKGTNTVFLKSFNAGSKSKEYFTFALSSTIGYKIARRLIVNADIMYSFFKTNFEYIEETGNRYTGQTITSTTGYYNPIHMLTIGIGVIVVLNPATEKK